MTSLLSASSVYIITRDNHCKLNGINLLIFVLEPTDKLIQLFDIITDLAALKYISRSSSSTLGFQSCTGEGKRERKEEKRDYRLKFK